MDAYEILQEDDHLKPEGCDDLSTSEKEHGNTENLNDQSNLHPLVDNQSPCNGKEYSKVLQDLGQGDAHEWNKKDDLMTESSISSIDISFGNPDNSNSIVQPELDGNEPNLSNQSDLGENTSSGNNENRLVFVVNHATEFGLGSSESDQLINSPTDSDDLLSSSADKKPELKVSVLSSKDRSKPEEEDASSKHNRAFSTESEPSSPAVIGSDKSPLLPDHGLVKDLLKKTQPVQGVKRDNDKVPLLPSPTKTEASSEEDSTLMSASLEMELESLRSPGQPSSDAEGEDQGVCSKYSQLSEDGSSPSSFSKMQTSDIGNDGKPTIFENSLELGVAFSEFVDMNSFSASLGKRIPQTEDKFGGKFEDHLLILLRSASHKNLKMFLRRSGWPAESDARCRLWENLCIHLVKAGGNLYEEMGRDLYKKQSSEEDLSLPPFVDLKLVSTYHLNTYGIHTAKMVINVLGHLNPDVLYCPLLFPLATAFLHYMGPNACFNCMQALLRSDNHSYLTATKTSTKACTLVLKDLAKKFTKSAYAYVTRGVDESVFDYWMYWLFQDLPFQTLVCVLDCFLIEGSKVLYRVVLAILNRFTKHMKKTRSSTSPIEDMKGAISAFCSSPPFDSIKLLKFGFSIRGLTRKEIYRLESKHQTHIKSLPPDDSIPKVSSSHSIGGVCMADTIPDLIVERGQKSVLTKEMLGTLWSWIPKRLTLKNASLVYTSDEHGVTLRTLLMKAESYAQTLLIIKNDQDEIFGAFCSSPWQERREKNKPHTSFFGTGETFVFTLQPKMKKYAWVGADGSRTDNSSDLFMAGDDAILIIGSGHGDAIQLDGMMNRCRSMRCDTFNNEPLSSKEDFICSVVQAYGFVD